MNDGDVGSLIYLVLLLCAVGGYFLVEGRQKFGKAMQQMAIWALIFVGVIAGHGLWSDIRSSIDPRQMVMGEEGRIEVRRRNDGHFHLTLEVQGMPVEFVVDTGASGIVLTREDAERVGLDPQALSHRQRRGRDRAGAAVRGATRRSCRPQPAGGGERRRAVPVPAGHGLSRPLRLDRDRRRPPRAQAVSTRARLRRPQAPADCAFISQRPDSSLQ